ncbi:hypothetical protein LG299_15505 [Microbacterium lacus]|uniref:hypothetical protein n=1 Tax=Microbacterium lacus TaxID=415217 RepID=UPI00384EFDDE
MITQQDLARSTGWSAEASFSVARLDLAGNDPGSDILSFLDDAKFLAGASRNPALRVLLVNPELLDEARERIPPRTKLIAVDDPRWHFYTLHNTLALEGPLENEPSIIDPNARIHPQAFIDDVGVIIAGGVVVEPHATVLRSARIGEGAVLRAGSVVGTPGFEHKRTSRGVLSVVHDGETRIGAGTEIGSLATVARGFARRHTVVGADCRIDSNAMIAHSAQLGERVFVAAGAVIAGSADVGDDVWIGPGATVIDRARIGAGARVALGSVVFTKVAPGSTVMGNPARPAKITPRRTAV